MADPLDVLLPATDPLVAPALISHQATQAASAGSAQGAALPDVATILAPVKVNDGGGGWKRTFAPVGDQEPCRIEKATRFVEAVQGGAMRPVTFWRALFRADLDLRATYRVSANGETWDVTDTDKGRSGATFLTAQLVKAGS